MWLNYFTFNGVAPIKDLHLVSDAGAGEGLMKYHPTRDTELIACGQANTPLKGRFFAFTVLNQWFCYSGYFGAWHIDCSAKERF